MGERRSGSFSAEHANLTPARSMRPAPRGRYVYDTLTATADRTQQSLKQYLAQHRVPFKSFWILNAIRVKGGGTVLQAIAERPEVAKIIPDVVFRVPPDALGTRERTPNTVEWGVDRIKAPQVWSTYNDRGENIVVGNVDTGVLYTHGALVAKYRGNLGGGTFNHNYNWWDPSAVCASADAVRQQRPRHAHDGNDGRRRRRSGHEPDRRRPARDVDRGQGLRDEQLLDERAAVVGPIHRGADRPQRPEPAAEPATRHRQQLVGQLERRRHLLPGDRPGLGRVGIFPSFASGNSGPGCGTVGSPGATPRATRSDRSTSTT